MRSKSYIRIDILYVLAIFSLLIIIGMKFIKDNLF